VNVSLQVTFPHRVPDDNHRILRFGLYSDASISAQHLIGQTVVSMTHLLSYNQVEADTFPLRLSNGSASGARLGVVMQVIVETARTKRYIPPELEFNLRCIMTKELKVYMNFFMIFANHSDKQFSVYACMSCY